MKDDYRDFLEALCKSPLMGQLLGKHLRKVRFPIASKSKGESGGARVITHTILKETDGTRITLVIIYNKSDQANIADKVFILLHHLPNQPDLVDGTIAPTQDAQRAIRLVRAHAAEPGSTALWTDIAERWMKEIGILKE